MYNGLSQVYISNQKEESIGIVVLKIDENCCKQTLATLP